MTYVSRPLEMLIGVVKKAGVGLVRDFSELEQLQSAVKGHYEFTQAAIERTGSILRNELNKLRPDMPVISSGDKLPDEECFVINPLDGSANFMHSIPYFAISLTHLKRGEAIYAVIYNPATGDTYFAEKGAGGFKEGNRNHLRTRVSARSDLKKAIVSVSNQCSVKTADAQTRTFGAISLDLANVAAGKFDGMVVENAKLAEVCAGIALLKESGGWVYAVGKEGGRTSIQDLLRSGNSFVAGNEVIGKKLFELV